MYRNDEVDGSRQKGGTGVGGATSSLLGTFGALSCLEVHVHVVATRVKGQTDFYQGWVDQDDRDGKDEERCDS